MSTFTDCTDNLICSTLSGSNGVGVGLVPGIPNKIVVSGTGNYTGNFAITGALDVVGAIKANRNDSIAEGGEIQLARAEDNAIKWIIDTRGSGDASDLRIFDNSGSMAVYIQSQTRNVGIGTTSPAEQLDLGGYGHMRALTGNGYGYLSHQYVSANALDYLTLSSNFKRTSHTAGSIANSLIGTTAIDLLAGGNVGIIAFSTGQNNAVPTERMRIDSNGNVGIGTAGPTSKLHVDGTITVGTNNPVYQAGILGYTDANFGFLHRPPQVGSIGAHHFEAYNGTDLLTIQDGGNVGIGTTDPAFKLDVNGVHRNSGLVVDYGNYYGFNLYYSGGWKYAGNGYGVMWVSNNAGGIDLYTAGNNVGGAGSAASLSGPYTTFANDGNVGIGTATPDAKLTVNGAIKLNAQGVGEGGEIQLARAGDNAIKWAIDVIGSTDSTSNLRFFDNTGSAVMLLNTSTKAVEVYSGIKFPATQFPSADPNTLDDYEEGTWTPTASGAGFSVGTIFANSNRYVKIGNMVFVTAYVQIVGTGTGGVFQISGLPFTSGTTTSAGNIGVFSLSGWTTGLHCYVPNSDTVITFAKMSGGLSSLLGTDLGTGPINIQFNVAYSVS